MTILFDWYLSKHPDSEIIIYRKENWERKWIYSVDSARQIFWEKLVNELLKKN